MDFIRTAAIRGSNLRQAVKIVLLDRNIARFWQNEIQPLFRASSLVRQRPDERWHWPVLLQLLPRLALLNGQRCFGYAVMTETAGGNSVPIALALVVEKYDLLESEDPGTFLWFAASAPTSAFAALTIPRVDDLGRVLIDVTITTTFNAGQNGCIGLHADPRR